jgi:hypothetical protein
VCKEFKVLPNDPRLDSLEPAQMEWVLGNMAEDNEKMSKALNRESGGLDAAGSLEALRYLGEGSGF